MSRTIVILELRDDEVCRVSVDREDGHWEKAEPPLRLTIHAENGNRFRIYFASLAAVEKFAGQLGDNIRHLKGGAAA